MAPSEDVLPGPEAAALGNGGTAAYQSLFEQGKVQAKEKILVLGASGGVGSIALQLACRIECEVTAICGRANVDWLRELAPSARVIAYDDEKGQWLEDLVKEEGGTFDAVLDVVGGYEMYRNCLPLLKPKGGRLRLLLCGCFV